MEGSLRAGFDLGAAGFNMCSLLAGKRIPLIDMGSLLDQQ